MSPRRRATWREGLSPILAVIRPLRFTPATTSSAPATASAPAGLFLLSAKRCKDVNGKEGHTGARRSTRTGYVTSEGERWHSAMAGCA